MPLPVSGPDLYSHVRVLVAMVVSLSIARLLTGTARFIQHPGQKVYPVHLGWAAFMLLYLVYFWWFEYRLTALPGWNFEIFVFVVAYSILLFLLCTLLFPDHIGDYSGYEDYFYSRRKWFFGILAATFVFDLVDTALKGRQHFETLGIEYPIRNAAYIVGCLIAMRSENRRFHAALLIAMFAYLVFWILRLFHTLA